MYRVRSLRRAASVACLVALAQPMAVPAQDAKGAVEPPITGRYEGSLIKQQSVRAFDRAIFMTKLNAQRKYEGIAVEGQRTLTALQGPRGRSALELFTNYANALRDAGFRTDFSCSREQCPRDMLFAGLGDDGAEIGRALSVYGDGSIEDSHYLVASRVVAAGTQYVRIAARGPSLPVVVLDIVQPAAMESKVKVIEAASLLTDIARQGHVALYAVFFDFDRAELKPESKPQIDELAKLLQSNPALKVHVVGHTDGQGKEDYNADLSRRRAAAVVAALVREHRIVAPRLSAAGVGALAPIATNDTAEGRAVNRRVEVVKRMD